MIQSHQIDNENVNEPPLLFTESKENNDENQEQNSFNLSDQATGVIQELHAIHEMLNYPKKS